MNDVAKRGRPQKKVSELQKRFPNWKNDVLELYEQGKSDVQVRAFFIKQDYVLPLGIWYKWLDEEPEFLETIKKGHILSEAWWQDQGQLLRMGILNTALWQINMTNRFNWKYGKDQEQFSGNIEDQLKIIADAISKSDTNTD